jgi:23S rRNA pseudouridine1911/1915/1917 synthase
MRFVVAPGQAGQRVDKLVVELLGGSATRAEVQRWIAEGRVTVDGRALDKKDRLEAGAALVVEPAPAPLSLALPDPSVRFAVIYEDEHLLVVDKPAGLVVHPARGHAGGTLVNGLLARGSFRVTADPRDPEGHLRPGIVHRIDKDTSGLLVIAKDAATREGLKALFSRHDIERSYLALVVGEARAARYDTPHGRHPKSRLRFTSLLAADAPGARRACTLVEPLERYPGATLVRCRLETGRTHQIRVHLLEQGKTPIVGDPLYGGSVADPKIRRIGSELGRQALHAAVLGLSHPISGEALRWESALPEDMARARAELTRRAT